MSENNSESQLKKDVESALLDIYNGMESANKTMENPDGDSNPDYKATCANVRFSRTTRNSVGSESTINFEVKLLD